MKHKSFKSLLARLSHAATNGAYSTVGTLLQEIDDPQALDAVREHKVLFRAHDRPGRELVAAAFEAAVRRLLPKGLRQQEAVNYSRFSLVVFDLLESLTSFADERFAAINSLGYTELVDIVRDALETTVDAGVSGDPFRESAADLSLDRLSNQVEAAERELHEISGASNDLSWAVARVFNELLARCSQVAGNRSGRRVRDQARQNLQSLIFLASAWNAVEYAVNKVTFGEWVITRISDDSEPLIVFDMVDLPLMHARFAAIRRHVVAHAVRAPQGERYIREMLEALVPGVMHDAAHYYTPSGLRVPIADHEWFDLDRRLRFTLRALDADDDMLLAAAARTDPQGAVAEYCAAVGMHWFAIVARFVAARLGRRGRALRFPTIPPEFISRVMTDDVSLQAEIASRIVSRVGSLPHSRPIELSYVPFVRIGTEIHALPGVDGFIWPASVRRRVLSNGRIGRDFGAAWEALISDTFADADWNIVGRRVKPRFEAKVLTDIDLLVLRRDLLLVVQIKATGSVGVTPYDHWKQRISAALGASQARKAVVALRCQPELLVSIAGRKLAAQVVRIEPVVITGSPLLNGWNCDGVPVISAAGLTSILEGARIVYRDVKGDALGIRHLVSPELTTSEILDLFSRPVDWHAALLPATITHSPVHIGSWKWSIPTLVGHEPRNATAPEALWTSIAAAPLYGLSSPQHGPPAKPRADVADARGVEVEDVTPPHKVL